jgi:uncharacterized protein
MSEEYKQIIRDVNAAFEANKIDVFLDACTDDIKWTMVGEKSTTGKQEILDWMASMGNMEPPKINIAHMISEGDHVACYGDMTMKDQSGTVAQYGYCDVYRFRGGKIAELDSFVAKIKSEGEQSASAA